MADAITIKALQDASLDAKSLEEVVNGSDTAIVNTRLGESYPSVKRSIKLIFESGGMPAKPYMTLAAAQAAGHGNGFYVQVTHDPKTSNNGLYIVQGSTLVKSKLDPMPRISISNSDNLNDLVATGVHIKNSSTGVSESLNYPKGFAGSGAAITVLNDNNVIARQVIESSQGTASRYGINNSGVWTFTDWTGIKYKGSVITQVGLQNIDNIAVLGGHLDKATKEGDYFINSGSIASTTNGFPVGGSGGFLSVAFNGVNVIHQHWRNKFGDCYRWGTLSVVGDVSSPITWQPWSGFKSLKNIVIDFDNMDSLSNENLVVLYGSSSLFKISEILNPELVSMGYNVANHAKSGDVIDGAGMAQGANVVTISFPSGTIVANAVNTVTRTSQFGSRFKYDAVGELSNGVKGTLYENKTFKPSNLTGNLTVSPSEQLRFVQPDFYNLGAGVYIINIGKNNVGVNEDNSQWLIDSTVAIINNLPRGSQFIVGGHFANREVDGSIYPQVINSINTALESKYGLKYFDFNKYLFDPSIWSAVDVINREQLGGSGITKTAADTTAINNRVLPPSLSVDTGHLSPEMNIYMKDVIRNKLINLGYIKAT